MVARNAFGGALMSGLALDACPPDHVLYLAPGATVDPGTIMRAPVKRQR